MGVSSWPGPKLSRARVSRDDLVNPDVESVIPDGHGESLSIGRETRVFKNPSSLGDRSDESLSVHPNESPLSRDPGNIDESAVPRESEMRRSILTAGPDSLEHGDRLARQFETLEIEGRRQKHAFPHVDEVTRRNVPGERASFEQNSILTAFEREEADARDARAGQNRKESRSFHSGRISGHRCEVSPRDASGVVTTEGEPPEAETRDSPEPRRVRRE